MFKVGDKVTLIDSKNQFMHFRGTIFDVVRDSEYGYTYVTKQNCPNNYVLQFETYELMMYSQANSVPSTKSGFKPNDRVLFKSKYGSLIDGKEGYVISEDPFIPFYYNVKIDSVDYQIHCDDLTLVHNSVSISAPFSLTLPSADNYHISMSGGTFYRDRVSVGAALPTETTNCQHNWKGYMGLNDREVQFEFCTLCNKEQGHKL